MLLKEFNDVMPFAMFLYQALRAFSKSDYLVMVTLFCKFAHVFGADDWTNVPSPLEFDLFLNIKTN